MCVCVHITSWHPGAQAGFPGGTEEMKAEQTVAADAAVSSSSRLSAAHPSAGQACNERINFSSPQSQPRYGWLMLVQMVTFPLANPLPTLEMGSAYALRPRIGSAWNQSLGPKSWPDAAAWYQRANLWSHCRQSKQNGQGPLCILALPCASCVTLRSSFKFSEL